MIINGCKTLILKCYFCGRLGEYGFNLFQVMKSKEIEYRCECGETNMVVINQGKGIDALVNCFYCNNAHYYHLSLQEMIRGNIIKLSPYGERILLLKNKEETEMQSLEQPTEDNRVNHKRTAKEYFSNFRVLTRALTKLYSLKRNRKISCSCGSSDISTKLFSDRIELICLNCNSVKLIFTETEEDLSVLLKKDKIVLKEKYISCIDSIKDKDRDIKE